MKKLTRKKAAKLWLMWIIIWPFIGVTAALVLFFVLGFILVTATSPSDGSAMEEPGLAGAVFFLVLTGILAAVFFTFAKNMKTKENASHSDIIGGKVLFGYTWLGIAAGVMVALLILAIPPIQGGYDQASAEEDAESNTSQLQLEKDPELAAILRDIGASQADDVSIVYADELEHPNWSGSYRPYTWSNDNSFAHGEINVLRREMSTPELYRIVAHEYLHHIWESKLDRQTRDNLTSHLITLHGRNSYMQQRVNEYSYEGTLLPTEIFAFACTEFSDGWLSEYIINQCNTHINRGALQMVY